MAPLESAAQAVEIALFNPALRASISIECDDPRRVHLAIVRAVLTAIREPSSAMTHAAQSESHVAGDCEVDYHGIWASMIDAALEEG